MSAVRGLRSFLIVAVATLASAPLLSAAIVLNSSTSPISATVGGNVNVTGTGFPVGTMPNTSVSVTITCPPGNGGAVSVNSTSVLTVGSQRIISFPIPAALSVNSPVSCQVTVSGSQPSAYSSSPSYSNITINPPPTVYTVSPGAGTIGTTVAVTITGNFTHFTSISPNQPTVTVGGTGVAVSAVNAVDSTHVNATFTVDPAATPGIRSVTVKTGSETATLATGFLVASSTPVSVQITPTSGAQGTTMDVQVTGTNTHFIPGLATQYSSTVTWASFGDTVKVNSVNVADATHATVNISIDPIAILGGRTFTITTGGEYGSLPGGFTVTKSNASLTSILPTGGAQGSSATITFTGNLTHWVQAGSVVSFGGGIVVGTVTVSSPTSLTANITVPAATGAGSYSATVTTNGEIVTLPGAFTVTAATPHLTNVSPTSGVQGGPAFDVNITGVFTTFTADTPTANFGPNITVNHITVTDDTHLTVNITIPAITFAGGRTASLTSHGSIYNFNFNVISSAAFISGISPGSGYQGASVAIQVSGVNTHWLQGTTQAALDPIWITINRVVVNSATSAEVDITIAANAPVGARTVTLSTGGEIVTYNSFTVLPYTPTMSVNPSSGMIGTTVPVVFNGSFTKWINNTTVANISGQGVSIQGFTVDTPWTAHASLVIDPTAPTSPALACLPGNRTLTLTTVSGSIDEIVTAPFCVTSTPAALISINPTHTAVPVNNLNVTITGVYTHFTTSAPNPTVVGFGPNITVSAPFNVSATSLTVTISIDPNAALGYRQAFVNTGTEQLSIGFSLDYPATSSLVSISPNTAAQGQSPSPVTITGNLTNWGPSTVAILGAGVTVSNLLVVNPTTATANVAVSPTTPVGGRTVSMITNNGAEVEAGLGFNITPSIASVSAIGIASDCSVLIECPAPSQTLANINQGDTQSFRVVGIATHFLQGETTLDFGPGISITQVQVVDETHLYGQITVSFQATPGYRSFRAITDGEVAPSFTNAVNVNTVTGTVNITPTSAQQGTTVDITVNGVGTTHFHTGDTTATFGNNNGIVGVTGGSSTIGPADITVVSASQAVLHVKIQGTAYVGLRDLTITTQNVSNPPTNIEQINLPLAFSISQGAGIVTQVTPSSDLQGHSVNLHVTGQNVNFTTGVTTAYLTTGGCNPPSSAGAVVTNVTATDSTFTNTVAGPSLYAVLAVAIDVNASTGIRGLCMYTLGESVGYLNAFEVLPGVPTFNGVTPVSGLQGQTLTSVALLGQFTNWTSIGPNPTNVSFGQGITVQNLSVTDKTHATVDLVIDPLAQLGGRTTIVTTGTEVVQGNFFSVAAGPAILSSINPSHANQGQHILMQVNGEFTHWAQGLTQFSIGGGDITVNGFLIQNQTTALADLTVSPTAYLGTRTVTMSTAGEVVSLNQGFLVTGGIPSLISISPSTYKQCDTNVNVGITGIFTKWNSPASSTSVYMGPNINVVGLTVNSDTDLTAIVNVPCGAPLGLQGITVQGMVAVVGGGTTLSGLSGQVQIISNAPPTPYISYEYPSVALKGQTLSVTFYGQYTHWLPTGAATPTQITMGAGIQVNDFQVTGLNSAVANITIIPTATVGSRNVVFTTGSEVETTTFQVTVGTPAISLVDGPDGSHGIQGQTLLVNLVGAYTTWTNSTVFNFGPGITVIPGSMQNFGPTAARVQISIDILAAVGGRSVSATTGAEVAYGYFAVSNSTATILTDTPNTAMQGTQGFVTHVVGFNTHWDNTTNFTFGGGDVGVASIIVNDATHADVTLNLVPLASPGLRNVTAVTGGEVATLVNGFVVTPGTPILTNCVNCGPGSGVFQQHAFLSSVLGQFTSFVPGWPAAGATSVNLGNGSQITSITVTGPQSVDIAGIIDPLAYLGCRDVTVTTGTQVLKLYGAFCIGSGPAVISTLNPNTALQGATLNVDITGTNTNFCCVNPPNITVGSFGSGISLNTLTVHSATSATANITIAANATAQQNSVTLITQGETATIPLGFTIGNNTPVVSFITPTTGAQGATVDVSVTGTFTHWSLANTTADFGTGITATLKSSPAPTATTATVHLVISPTAPTGNHAVRMLTDLGGGNQEIATYTIGAGNGSPGYFSVTSSGALISSATPTSPATVHQNDNGDIIAVVGSGTHFTAATPTVTFCSGVNTAAIQVVDDTHLNATVNVGTFATTGACGVNVTTGGEVATGSNLFNVLAGVPVITSFNPTSAHQNDTLNININGQYTHFTSGGVTAFAGNPNITVNGAPTVNNDGSISVNVTVGASATVGATSVTVHDTTDGTLTASSSFNILAGVPQITNVNPATGPQGLTQNITITGLYTHFSASSQVYVSGAGVTVGSVTSPDNFTIKVNFTVSVGAAATARTVQVTTGAEVVSLSNAFVVQPGSPNLSNLSPNVGVLPASGTTTVNVTITGVFTHFVNGATTADFGPGISVNGGAFGSPGLLTVSDATDATATLVIQSSAPATARNVTVTTPAPPLAAVETFTVNNGFTVESTPPTPAILQLSPTMGLSGTVNATGVPTNTTITVVFNEPMLASTITPANAFIYDSVTYNGCWASSGIPATVSLDLSGRVLTIQPGGLLAVGRTYYLNLNSYYVPGGTPTIQEATGTQNLSHYCQSFSTGFASDPTGPTFVTGSIPAGATGVPTNVHPTVGFDKPVNPATMSGLSFVQTSTSTPVIGTWSYSSDLTQFIFTPAANLTASTQYTLAFDATITDSVGHALTNPGNFSFTTGATTDYSGPSVVSITPIYNSTVPSNPVIRFITNKPMNPLTVNQMYMYNQVSGAYVTGNVTHSADFKTWNLELSAPLDAGTQWRFNSYSMYDWAGNCCVSFNQYFYTGPATDSTSPSVVSVSPADTLTNISVNAPVWVHFSEALDPTQVPANAITLNGGAVAGSIAFAPGPDYSTLVFTPTSLLSPSTTYTVNVSGLQDVAGNPMSAFAATSFQTSATATADATHGTVTITPGSGATVAVNTNVVFQLSKPVNPLSINYLSMRVYDNTISHDIPGTVAVSVDRKTLTYTPTASCTAAAHCLPANHSICTWDYNGGTLYDEDGLAYQSAGLCFTTTNTADLTVPTVTVTPPDASTGVGPNNPVVLTFSKPINPGSISTNVALYIGSNLYTTYYSLSQDSTTVSFSIGNMPYGTVFTVVATPNITDLAGNHLANEFRSSFTTAPQPVITRPSVNVMRPGNGATGVPTTAAVTFFTSAAMDTSTVNANTVHISENGVLKTGAISFSAGNQAIQFTPTTSFTAGSLIQVWFTSHAKDVNGNALYDYYGSFTVAAAPCVTPSITAYTPGRYSGSSVVNYLLNPVIEVQFCGALNPATVTNSTFVVTSNSSSPGSGSPIAGTLTLVNGNTTIRFQPSADLTPGQYIAVQMTNNIKDASNNAFGGDGFWIYIQGTATHDATPPFVTGQAPTTGAGSIGTNAVISLTFSENVDTTTLIPANVALTGPGGSIPVSLSYNSTNYTLTITPQAPLPAGANVTLQLSGVTDYAGNALSPNPYNTNFNTAPTPDYNAPGLVLTSLLPGQGSVPLTASFSITFTKPIDLRTVVVNNSIYLQDASAGYQNIPFTMSWSAGNTVLLITPTPASGLLNVGHQYRVLAGYGFSDLNGNVASNWIVNQYFTTALTSPAGGPTVSQFVPPDASTNVPENFKPQFQFDRPIQPGVLGGVTFVETAGSVPVPMSPQLSGGGTLLTLVPNTILKSGKQYTLTVSGVVDAAGNAMSGSLITHFTTGATIDLSSPSVVSMTPINGATVGTNPLLKVSFNKPINPISATNYAVYQYSIGRYENQVSLTWAADLKSVILNLPGALNPNDHYFFYLYTFADLAGNTNNTPTQHFYTSSSVDNTPLTVTSVDPPNGILGVPVNSVISVRLNKPVAPTSVSNSSVTLSGVSGATVGVSSDGMTLSLGLPGVLTANLAYTIQVPGGAFTDGSGNAVSAFSSTFTTSASGLSDTSHGGVSLTSPSPGSTGVALNSTVTVTFTKPYNPNSIVQDSFMVCYSNDCNRRIAGTITMPSANTLLFTPAVALPPGATLGVFVYPFTSYMTDLAGNNFDSPYLYNATFTTASVVDNTPPSVSAVTPIAASTNVGPYASVSLTFNKSLDPSTVNASNFALYLGPNNLGSSISISADRRTVYFGQTLPWNATVTVTANTSVKDYAGNNMSSPFSSTFTTEAQPLNFNPSVTQTRPGNGAPLNSKITIYTNSQIDLTSAQNGVQVAQNGALVAGTVSLSGDLHGIIFTPAASFQPSAYIEVWTTSTVTDVNRNSINSNYFTFTTQGAACTTPTITAYPSVRYTSVYITNPVIDVQFCEPIDPATVTSGTFNVRANSSTPGSGTPIAGAISFANNNTLIRFTPSADFTLSQYFAVQMTSGIQDMASNAFAGDGFWVYVQGSAVHDNTLLTVSSVTPVNAATGIGDNAPVRIVFSKAIDHLTANPSSVTLSSGGSLPYTYTLGTVNGSQTVMNLTPLAALPDNATINVHVSTAVTDLTGASVPDFTSSFQTGAGGDFNGPVLVQRSIDDDNDIGVPTNTTFTMTFNKPLDPSTVNGNPSGNNTCCFFYYDSTAPGGLSYPPSTVTLSADLKTVTIIPSSSLTPSSGSMRYYWYSGADLNGNTMATGSQFFTTAAGTDSSAPTVVQTNPVNAAVNVPTNVVPEIIFNKPVRATSLSQFTLNGSPVTAVLNNGVYGNDTVVKLVPSTLLSAGSYTVVATGVQDVAGNTLASPFTFQFTTGPNFNINTPVFQSATVTNNTPATVPLPQNTNVSNVLKTNPIFTFTWDQGIDFASLAENGAIYLTDTSNNHINVPLTFSYPSSPDQKTVQVQVNGSLTGSTQYRIWIYYNQQPVSLTGVHDYNQRMFPFTTEP